MKPSLSASRLLALAFAVGIAASQPCAAGTARPASYAATSPLTLAQACQRQLDGIERTIVEAAEAMPEDKFDFTPGSLKIPGSEFEGVRTFAGQVKHLATDNYAIWSPLTGDAMPAGNKDVNGPADLRSKAEILKFLKGSFALGHRAMATLTVENAVEMLPFRGMTLPRIDLAFFALTHDQDHYGQMVVYLRMCGIVPPASRPR